MKNKRKRAACLLLALLCVVQLLTVFCLTATAAGETSANTHVLDDLKRDPDFKTEKFPDNPNDLSLQVITIAESTTRELLVYVYQPAAATQPLTATSINISESHKAIEFHNYTLTLLNQEGVFQKYRVDDLVVSNQSVRYYEITNIYRKPLNKNEQSTGYDDGNVVNELSNPVGKGYQFTGYSDGVTSLVVEDIDFIRVTDKYVGFMRYPEDSFTWWTHDELDVHFVAFSTNRKIDKLFEADVFYVEQHATANGSPLEYGKRESKYSYLKFDEGMKYEGDSWISLDYEWKTIEKSSDFLATEETIQIFKQGVFDTQIQSSVDYEAKQIISSKDWVLRFAYTNYFFNFNPSSMQSIYDFYIVGEVSILRLAFETDGVYYNLGVVDNKQTGKDSPDNAYNQSTKLNEEWFEKILAVLLLVAACVLLAPILPSLLVTFIIKPVWWVIKFLFNLIWKILLLPFKIIKKILFPKKE